jgi:hypothetical protein
MEVPMSIPDSARRERERCAAICRRRAELWRTTMAARSGIAAAQEEARARANEAAYLADLIESGRDLDDEPDGRPIVH